MPQMSPLLWAITIVFTINLLLITTSFLYFINLPDPHNMYSYPPVYLKLLTFTWLW